MMETNQARASAAFGGDRYIERQRLAERFEVPEAFLICERRNFVRLWHALGGPCRIIDVGVSGVRFANFGPSLEPGALVRLNLHFPRRTGLRVKAQIVHTNVRPAGIGQHCGATFIDFDASFWQTLCDLHAEYGSMATTVRRPEFEEPKSAPDVGGFLEAISA